MLKGSVAGYDATGSPLRGAAAGRKSRQTPAELAMTPLERQKMRAEAISLRLAGMSYRLICEEINGRYQTGIYPAKLDRWIKAYGMAKEEDQAKVQQVRHETLVQQVGENLAEMDRRHLEELREVQKTALEAMASDSVEFKDKRQAGDVYLGALREERAIVAPHGKQSDEGQLVVQINLGNGQIQQAVMPMVEPTVSRKRTGLNARQRSKDGEPKALPEPVAAEAST